MKKTLKQQLSQSISKEKIKQFLLKLKEKLQYTDDVGDTNRTLIDKLAYEKLDDIWEIRKAKSLSNNSRGGKN